MLADRYFVSLGRPDEERLRHLPYWAIRYERELRALASWWHSARHGQPTLAAPVPREPASERVFRLPIWAFEWINDLRFEVYWQRHLTMRETSVALPEWPVLPSRSLQEVSA